MLLQINGFSGSANILGHVCRVEYDGEGLLIRGISFERAREVLLALDLGVFTAPSLEVTPNDGRERFDERVAVQSEGGAVTREHVVRARQEAQQRPQWMVATYRGQPGHEQPPVPTQADVNPLPQVRPTASVSAAQEQALRESMARANVVAAARGEPVAPWEDDVVPQPKHEAPVDPKVRALVASLRDVPAFQQAASTDLAALVRFFVATQGQWLPEAVHESVVAVADLGTFPTITATVASSPDHAFEAVSRLVQHAREGVQQPAQGAPAAATGANPSAPPAGAQQPAAASGDGEVTIPANVVKATTLRPVVDFAHERLPIDQQRNLNACVAAVEKLRGRVDILAKIDAPKLRDRVERTMIAMELLPGT